MRPPTGDHILKVRHTVSIEKSNEIAETFQRAITSAWFEWQNKDVGVTWNDILIYHLDSEIVISKEEDIIKGDYRLLLDAL